MKLLILSDLHLEFGLPYALPSGVDFDIVVLAGDISCPGTKAVAWAKRDNVFGGKPVVLVAGNHEFYGRSLPVEIQDMKAAAAGSNVYFLDRGRIDIGGVRFLGCTLWTDFQLPVRTRDGHLEANVEFSLREASERMADFRLIEIEGQQAVMTARVNERKQFQRLLRPEDTLAQHYVDRDWLRRQLLEPFNGPTVVVTHHAPARGSVASQYADSWLTPAFVSEMPSFFFDVPQVWVHGHTHSPFDYMVGRCRVVSNPRGYGDREDTLENRQFSKGFIVDLAA